MVSRNACLVRQVLLMHEYWSITQCDQTCNLPRELLSFGWETTICPERRQIFRAMPWATAQALTARALDVTCFLIEMYSFWGAGD